MNVDTLRHELTDLIACLGYEEMLQLRGYIASFSKSDFMPYLPSVSKQALLEGLPVRRVPGALKGNIWISEDFDETPDCFEEYL